MGEQRDRQEKQKALYDWLSSKDFKTVDEKKVKKKMLGSSFQYPLHVAVTDNNPKAVHLLLWGGASRTSQNGKNHTPLALAQTLNKNDSHKAVIDAFSV